MNNFLLILLLAAFPALTTDMYLPAVPQLCELWDIPLSLANLSLVAFFFSFSLFLLVHGPLSDRFGRRPVLLTGIPLYIVASLGCAAAPSIAFLVAARVLQALGAAAAATVCLALVKDLYAGEARRKLLAYVGVIIPLCPMVAPTLGALMMEHVSWRGIFVVQALMALPALYGALRLPETLAERGSGGVGEALARYGRLSKNGPYMLYALSFAVVNLAFFAFIGGSSDIYINGFGLSERTFGLYFAFNALAMMLGSFLCARLTVGMGSWSILLTSLLGMAASAAALSALGANGPAAFAGPMFSYSLFLGLSRPISNDMILEQVDRDTGTASSVLTFFNFLVAAVAMQAISFDWPSKPLTIAVMGMAGAGIPLAVILRRRPRR
ncbi:multidrug effflux MFS transporter [Desulfocurvus sp. DL9XJH121]